MVAEIFIKQLDGCTYMPGGFNCTTAAHAMWLYRASQGRIRTTSCAVRSKTRDRSGGTNLSQMEQISIAYGITNGRVYRPALWATLDSLIASKRYGFHLSVSYRSIAGTKYDCFGGNFKGNHALYVSGAGSTAGTWRVADPGADGRRSGIPKGYQNIPVSLLKKAAGELDLGQSKRLGFGKAYAYATPPDPIPSNLWGSDVTAANKAVDPTGQKVGAAIKKTGLNYGTVINTADLQAALRKIGHNYGSAVDPSDVQVLLNWAK